MEVKVKIYHQVEDGDRCYQIIELRTFIVWSEDDMEDLELYLSSHDDWSSYTIENWDDIKF